MFPLFLDHLLLSIVFFPFMHEFSICQGLVETIVAEAAAAGPVPKRVTKARVVVGDLRQIVPDTLQFAYETLTKDTCAASSVLEIIHKPATGVCAICAWEGELQGPVIGFVCAKCGAIEGKLTGGRELFLESMEVENDE